MCSSDLFPSHDKEVVAVKVERGFSRESRRRRERKKERKMPRSSVLGVADDTGRSAPEGHSYIIKMPQPSAADSSESRRERKKEEGM